MQFLFLFFFKQKTAYEMRISDWSSDVCSSDLSCPGSSRPAASRVHFLCLSVWASLVCSHCHIFRRRLSANRRRPARPPKFDRVAFLQERYWRSEEHTSELQSLMRISYAVFCWKKKKQQHKSYPAKI